MSEKIEQADLHPTVRRKLLDLTEAFQNHHRNTKDPKMIKVFKQMLEAHRER
jgi:hypothetical protein